MEFAGLAAIGNPADFVDRAVVPRRHLVGVFDHLINEITEVEHEAELIGGKEGITLETREFTLKRGKKELIRVTMRPKDDKVIASPTIALPKTFTNSLGMEFVLVPKGRSWLGGGDGKPGDEEVEIVHDFYLGKYVVTQEEWEKVMGSNPSLISRRGAGKVAVKAISDADLNRFPVENVSWNDTQKFLRLLNDKEKKDGWMYRLPREVEWEYACRGGRLSDKSQSAFHFYLDKPTNQLLAGQANFEDGKGLKRTCKVGSYRPNSLGLYDMHGNVWQWCDDLFDPKDKAKRDNRVSRGGSWMNNGGACRATHRYATTPDGRGSTRGFRVARVPVR